MVRTCELVKLTVRKAVSQKPNHADRRLPVLCPVPDVDLVVSDIFDGKSQTLPYQQLRPPDCTRGTLTKGLEDEVLEQRLAPFLDRFGGRLGFDRLSHRRRNVIGYFRRSGSLPCGVVVGCPFPRCFLLISLLEPSVCSARDRTSAITRADDLAWNLILFTI
ncbi:hypothetical protein RRF57_013100 [Xylaria bambusicola]|uniref:Uncharacterized protein n=1 Tax=Xylaria bambusicola TaxID=326684 RepID=A0AAN7ZFB7_9PEZI